MIDLYSYFDKVYYINLDEDKNKKIFPKDLIRLSVIKKGPVGPLACVLYSTLCYLAQHSSRHIVSHWVSTVAFHSN